MIRVLIKERIRFRELIPFFELDNDARFYIVSPFGKNWAKIKFLPREEVIYAELSFRIHSPILYDIDSPLLTNEAVRRGWGVKVSIVRGLNNREENLKTVIKLLKAR